MNSYLSTRRFLFGGIIGLAVLAIATTSAVSFGTIQGGGQNAEHGRITRQAFTCASGSSADRCFQPKTLDNLAGSRGSFGAVGAPDRGRMTFESAAHCSAADYFDVPGYPQTRSQAQKALSACRDFMMFHLHEAVRDARALLDDNGAIRPSQIPTNLACTFAGSKNGRAKCNVIAHFGYLLHASQDFYAHTNWVDHPVQDQPLSLENPPGLGQNGPAAWLNLRKKNVKFPNGLVSGCFEAGSFISEEDYCKYGTDSDKFRLRHLHLNKDLGTVQPKVGAGTTLRGKINGNFARAAKAAIADTADKWATLSELLVVTYGADRGGRMICALTRDHPTRDCR